MLLMNAPPVVAVQSKWEAFGPPGSFRFPGGFSESSEDAARAPVSARVQMIIGTLRQDEAAPGMNDKHGPQRSQRAERSREARPAADPAPRTQRAAACGPAAHHGPPGDRGASSLGPSVQDSDSDDSVDRDIEEAIQEYLKAKSGTTPPVSGGAQPGGASRCKSEPHSSAPPAPGPPKPSPRSGAAPGGPGAAGADQGSASPVSVSSEDSFEQSIRAEIEQFLNEKRQHENPKWDGSVDKKSDPSALKPPREPPCRAGPRHDLPGDGKEFVFRKPPRLGLARGSPQPRGLRPQASAEPDGAGSARPPAPKPEAAQSKAGRRSAAAGAVAGGRGRRGQSAAPVREASDSSSDDGIEEAIQLYQLQKTRKEAGGGDPPPRAQLREDAGPGTPASSTASCTKSALPEAPRRTPSKRKPAAPKTADPGPLSKLPKDARSPLPPGNTAARSEPVERASCRADSAELMCAEAILDISKTILPAPVQGSDRPPAASPLFPPNVPSHSDGDSSSVDSDDSIEQEIRTFLALKAQSGSALATAESCPLPAQDTLSPPGPNGQAGVPKAPLSKMPDVSPSCKRKQRGGGGGTVRLSTPKRMREVGGSAQDGGHSQGKAQPGPDGQDPPPPPPGQGKASEAPGREGEAQGQPVPPRTGTLGDLRGSQGRSLGEMDSSEDKSSSLDSDEDLDTAIKDLLRSKRTLRKRGRGSRASCRKKVRFSTTETRFMDRLGGLPRDWTDGGPPVLRSCLSTSRRDSRASPARKLPGLFSSTAERPKPAGSGDEAVGPAPTAPTAPGCKRRAPPEGAVFCQEADARDPVCSGPSSLSEDSSVDSDDSIELEIRKFLAEKAKESVSGPEIQGGGHAAPGAGSPARPEALCRKELAPALQPGVCTRSQRARAAPQLAEGLGGADRAGAQAAASLFAQAGRGTARVEHPSRLAAALGRCEPALPGNASARAPPAGRRTAYALKDQSPQGAEPAAPESAFGQLPGGATAGAEAGGAGGTFHAGFGSRSLLTPSPGPQTDLAAPWSDLAQQRRLPSPWALNSEGRASVWTGGLGERGQGPEGQARLPHGLGPRKSLPFTGFAPLRSAQLFHFGKSVSWGGKQAGLFRPHLGLPLPGPAFSAFRESAAGRGPVFGSLKDAGLWPGGKAQAGLALQDGGLLDLRHRPGAGGRDGQDPEALGSDASECSDTSVEDGGSPLAKGKALQL